MFSFIFSNYKLKNAFNQTNSNILFVIEDGVIDDPNTCLFQEGLLDIDLKFSDGSRTALRDVAISDYYLLVESLDPNVVAFAPMLASRHPRVIAVGEGKFCKKESVPSKTYYMNTVHVIKNDSTIQS